MGKWEMVRLGDVCEIARGGSPRPIDNFITDDPNGVNWIKIGDTVEGEKYITKTKQKIIVDGVKKSRCVKAGDFLLSNSMSFGRPYILAIDGCIHDGWLVISDSRNLFSKDFLYYLLDSPSMYNQFKNLAVGGVVNNLNSDIVRNVQIPLPPLDEQKRIAKNLDLASEIVKGYKEQLAQLDKLVQSVFYEMFGDPVTNEKGWEAKLLGSICDGIGDGLHGTPTYDENGKYPFINGNNLVNGCILITDATKYIGENEYQRLYIDIVENAILISINGTLGKLALYNGEKISLSKSACYCNLKPEINRLFVYWIMKSRGFANFLEGSSTKSTIKNVGLKAMREFKTILPPLPLQTRFASIVTEIEAQKVQVQEALTEAENLFNSLMQEYFE